MDKEYFASGIYEYFVTLDATICLQKTWAHYRLQTSRRREANWVATVKKRHLFAALKLQ
jgi:hypothetical protein